MVDGLDRSRMRLLAARVVAAHAVEQGATFVDTFGLLTGGHGFTRHGAWHIVSRVFACGGFSRDLIYLRGLNRLLQYLADGSEHGFDQQVDRFVATLVAASGDVERAHATRDLAVLGTCVHRLLGHARMVNARALIETSERLEVAAQSGDEEVCDELVPRLHAAVANVREALRHRRSSAATG